VQGGVGVVYLILFHFKFFILNFKFCSFLECGCKPPNATSRLQTLKSSVLDITGAIISSKEIVKNNDFYNMDVLLAKGVYFVKIKNTNNEELVKKLLVE
jgi:Secretion system C-terminal sorting domain